MTKPVTISNIFQNQVGPIPLIELDQNFSALAAVQNDFATYSNYLTDVSGAANQITVSRQLALRLGTRLELAFKSRSPTRRPRRRSTST